MNVTDLARYRSRKSRDDRARELALWRVFSGVYADLCEHGLIDYDAKALRRQWEDYVRGMPRELRARAMIGDLG